MTELASEQEPKEGSSLYYSLLYCPLKPRQRFLQTLALIDTLSSVLHEVHEAQVAEKKIHWWHEELDRLHAGQAKHPQSITCQHWFTGNDLLRQHSFSILSVAANERYDPTKTDEQWQQRLTGDFQARLTLLGHALSATPEGQPAAALWPQDATTEMAFAFATFERLRRLPQLLHRGYDVYSQARYEQYQLSSDSFADEKDKRRQLLKQCIDETKQAFSEALRSSAFTEHPHAHLLPLLTLTGLRSKQVTLWHKKQPDLLRESISVTPIRKLLLAWQYRSRYRD